MNMAMNMATSTEMPDVVDRCCFYLKNLATPFEPYDWILDIGCVYYMSFDRDAFVSYELMYGST